MYYNLLNLVFSSFSVRHVRQSKTSKHRSQDLRLVGFRVKRLGMGHYVGRMIGLITRDTRSLDYGSYCTVCIYYSNASHPHS